MYGLQKDTLQRAARYLARNHRHRIWKRAVSVLACIVVFCTTYALILPALTMEKTVYCGSEAHQHGPECYEKVPVCGEEEGGSTGHLHTENCYESVLTCGKEEHIHELGCYSNPEADVESPDVWSRSVSGVELTGNWRSDLVAVAESQLGYTESARNFAVDENETKKGYTRYGAWYGEESAYEDWNSLFVLFCLDYAGIPDGTMPRSKDCREWMEALGDGVHAADGGYEPAAGDLVFFDADQDGSADRVGIVTKASEALSGSGLTGIEAIQGDTEDRVQSVQYIVEEDETILGYAALPENSGEDTGKDRAADKDEGSAGESILESSAEGTGESGEENLTEGTGESGAENLAEGIGENSEANLAESAGESKEEGGAESAGEDKSRSGRANVSRVSAARAGEPDVFTDTVSPASSVINVFDYWVDERFPPLPDGDGNKNSKLYEGINQGHALKFRKNWGGDGSCNNYVGNDVVQGIVEKILSDGYPKLSGDMAIVNGGTESLAYLFDPDYRDSEPSYRKVFRGVQGLLYDKDGYYTYDSTEYYAYLNEENKNSAAAEAGNRFTLYNDWAVTNDSGIYNGQFFPFNPYPDNKTIKASDSSMYHYFGVTLTARFMQQYGGYTNASRSTPTTFQFSGDDDVWIFIDDVLVADLGGIHNKINTIIDFSTGTVEISGTDPATGNRILLPNRGTTIKAAFTAAGRLGDAKDWNGNTFADNTSHTLKFFYMERGNGESNMSLQYNLNEIPPTAVYKINQYGNPVEGAGFSVYKCDNDWNIYGDPVYSGTTNDDGEMVFLDDYGMPYSLTDLEKLFGERFVLKETKVPDGYRLVTDEIHLRIQNGALVCDNTYDSGVWASPILQVTAPNNLTFVGNSKEKITYYDPEMHEPNGTLFAVVLKYIGPVDDEGKVISGNLAKQMNWAPVSGNPKDGYTVDKSAGDDRDKFVEAAIKVARSYGEQSVFKLSSSGVMQASLENLPGKVIDYYYMLGEDEKDQTQYTVGYYWTSADSLAGATIGNTSRVDSENETHSFYREFGANIEVPNLANRLLVQKFDEKGNLVNGATFALFQANENGTYIADNGAEVSLEEGQYEIEVQHSDGTQETTGSAVITTKSGQKITSYEQRTTNSSVLKDSDGTCVFGIWGKDLTSGCYYLREVEAPAGYKINTTPIMVRVTEDAIYANAGTADDGVTVARGPGYIVSPLHKAASEGDIDNTLTWIYQKLKVSGESTSFKDAVSENRPTWAYARNEEGRELASYLHYTRTSDQLSAESYLANYEVDKSDRDENDGIRTRTQQIATDVGWSYNEIYQDYAYGLKQLERTQSSANYTDLSREGDISYLFSRTVYVQVTDERIPSIRKINQYGDPIKGAEFAVYRVNDGTWDYAEEAGPVCTGTTDDNGELVFRDEKGDPYSLNDLKEKAGDRFILKETKVPDGYRLVSDEIRLRIRNGVLVCDNTYDSGVWASPTLQVTAPDELTLAESIPLNGESTDKVTYYSPGEELNGTLFAVALKYTGPVNADGTVFEPETNLTVQENWTPVSGSPKAGYHLESVEEGFTAAVIAAARSYGEDQNENQSVFQFCTDDGRMQANLENLPGKVINYYHMLGETEKDQTQYTIGYYWTSGSLAEADSANTYRVDAEDETNSFQRVFGEDMEVPDLSNRLLVQKFDEEGNLVNGATFALFQADEDGNYMVDETTGIRLEEDKYIADAVPEELREGEYTIDVTDASGDTMGHSTITARVNGELKTVTSREQRVTNDLVLENSDGTCVFGIRDIHLTPGCYYLREVKAPEGYKINTVPIMVRVTENAIYANAGTADDGVTVARGPGYIVSPLYRASSAGDIDNTLTWIYQKLKVSGESASFTDVPPDSSQSSSVSWDYARDEDDKELASYLKYSLEPNAFIGAKTYLTNYKVDEGRSPLEGTVKTGRQQISTDVGWSYNEIYQDYDYGIDQLITQQDGEMQRKGRITYTDLRGEEGAPKDISKLFSRSVYVQVTDERVSDLEISKTVVDVPEGMGVSDKEFTFTVTIEGAKGEYDYAIYESKSNNEGGKTPIADGTGKISSGGTITLKDGQTVVITGLPAVIEDPAASGGYRSAKYTVTEKPDSSYKTSYRVDGGTEVPGHTASGTLKWAGGEEANRTSAVEFTNRYAEPLDLVLQKYETGTEIPLEGAKFVLYTAENLKHYYFYQGDSVQWVVLAGDETPDHLALTTNAEGKISFRDIPDGTYYLKEIVAPDGYTLLEKEIPFTVTDGKIVAGPEANYTDITITVYNSAGVILPDTGGPGTTLFTISGLLLLAVAAGYGYRMRRRRERRREI